MGFAKPDQKNASWDLGWHAEGSCQPEMDQAEGSCQSEMSQAEGSCQSEMSQAEGSCQSEMRQGKAPVPRSHQEERSAYKGAVCAR